MNSDELKAYDSQDRIWHASARRQIASRMLVDFSWAMRAVGVGFLVMSAAAICYMFQDGQWTEKHKDIAEVLKFAWTVSATVVVNRMSAIIFKDHEN